MLTAVRGRYSNTVTHTFDSAGRKATESLTIGGQTYTATSTYDIVGVLSQLTYPSSLTPTARKSHADIRTVVNWQLSVTMARRSTPAPTMTVDA